MVKGHKCKYCSQIFNDKAALVNHLTIHAKTREFICVTCGKTFTAMEYLKRHETTHSTKRYKCSECDRELKNARLLKFHMRQHTGERPYKCDLCEKTFVSGHLRLKHLRVHRNERPYPCTLCEKKFATSYHLKRHMNSHTGTRLYPCDLCGRSFMQNETRKAHQLRKHPPINPMD